MTRYSFTIDYDKNLNGYIVLRQKYPVAEGKEIHTKSHYKPWVQLKDVEHIEDCVFERASDACAALYNQIEEGPDGTPNKKSA